MKKMKKRIFTIAVLFSAAATFAYNPPAGGQNVLRVTSPELLTGAKSAAGGPLFNVTPSSILNNPALPAFNQRNTLDLAGTLFFDSKDDNHSLGGAFELGLIKPTRWCVPSVLIQGVFVPYYDMQLGNSINLTLGYSKDITDTVSIGLTANVGLLWSFGTDWTASAGLGAYYNPGDIAFFKNVRFGAAITNLGKMYSKSEVLGIKAFESQGDWYEDSFSNNFKKLKEDEEADKWPALATFRTGVAASLIDAENFKLGLSLDTAFPTFQNVVLDAGVNILIAKVFKISSAWEFDLREFKEDAKNLLPSVGVSFKFVFKSKDDSYLSRNGWGQSEVTASAAWQRMYKNVDAVSAGLLIDLGLEDTQPPEIMMWNE